MSAADAVRALADSGTPGPWEVGDITPGAYAEHIPAYADIEPLVAGGIDPTDAAKIVAAVNALPKVADLIDAVDRDHREFGASCVNCGGDWPCEYAAARDALVEALGVSS